jgi:homoserine dehydrogenase
MNNHALKIGIAGLGTIGVGVVRVLQKHGGKLAEKAGRPVELVAVCDLDRTRDRGVELSSYEWFDDAIAMAQAGSIDTFVELIGGEGGIALKCVQAALKAGKHVVTANKAMLAKHGSELAELAEENNVFLYYEAAVAGGIPIVKTLRESLAGNDITRVYGIMNGTCNYILTKMEDEGKDFAQVLKDAQDLGYAEADPTADIGGFDTAHKLALLTALAFGTRVDFDSVYVEGIERISSADLEAARNLGYRIKLLGVAVKTDTGIEQRVHPTMVPLHSAIAEVHDVFNAVMIDGDFIDELMLMGRGAGEGPTASSVVSDLVDLARGGKQPVFGIPVKELRPYQAARMRTHEGGYYVRLTVPDQPGIMAAITSRMAEHGISLESIVQRAPENGEDGAVSVSVILITHETTELEMRGALDAIFADGTASEKPQMIRIERA